MQNNRYKCVHPWLCIAVILLCLSNAFSALAAGPYFSWAVGVGGSTEDAGFGVVTDSSGNVYLAGHFQGTVDFDPGSGTTELSSAGQLDMFLSKFDKDGNFVWVKQFGDTGANATRAIDIDSFGNIFLAGTAGTFSIAKLDSDGNLLWSKNIPGTTLDITVDLTGNILLAGSFSGERDFDPGAGVFNLDAETFDDGFICKLTAGGIFEWAVNFAGHSYVNGITIDNNGNILVTGNYDDTTDFDPGVGTRNLLNAGDTDFFIVKLNAQANFTWARGIGSSEQEEGKAIGTDSSRNVYITGDFEGPIDFDAGLGTTELTSNGGFDAFVCKYTSNGTFSWVKKLGGTSYDYAHSLAVDSSGNVYTSGNYWYQSSADFDPGSGQHILSGIQYDEVYISKLDTDGNYIWAGSIEGASPDYGGYDLHIDTSDNVYVTGIFTASVDADPTQGQKSLTSNGTEDIFLTKLTATRPASTFNWTLILPVLMNNN